ncbi:uncharacterized protein TNCV_1773781 [Trichonephila clavipes]|nr:uncharacterized protein TNCV_1773781 [Trichonephila clavipes]
MEVTRVEHRAYIKIVVFRGRNAIECHSELVATFETTGLCAEKLEHPPYTSNISPCDFDLISKIKKPIRGRRFATRDDFANAVRQQVTRFTQGAANAEADGIQCLPHRWQNLVTVAGNYIEGP